MYEVWTCGHEHSQPGRDHTENSQLTSHDSPTLQENRTYDNRHLM